MKSFNHTNNQYILKELEKGNMGVLNGVSPELAIQYGLALQEKYKVETQAATPSNVDIEAVGSFLKYLNKDHGFKEAALKRQEEEEAERKARMDANVAKITQ